MFFPTKKLMFQPTLVLLADPTPPTPTPPKGGNSGIKDVTVPGKRCPACLEKGDTIWVIPGKCCPQCGTPVGCIAVEENRNINLITTKIKELGITWMVSILASSLGIIALGCFEVVKDWYILINDIVINKPSYILGCVIDYTLFDIPSTIFNLYVKTSYNFNSFSII